MKILIICSKAFYNRIPPIRETLESMGHTVELPNSYYYPQREAETWAQGAQAHGEFKAKMFRMSWDRIAQMDAVLTLNFDKNGQKNYIGGATFLELYDAFMAGKKIFLYHDIPQGMLYDEIAAFMPVVIHEDLSQVVSEVT